MLPHNLACKTSSSTSTGQWPLQASTVFHRAVMVSTTSSNISSSFNSFGFPSAQWTQPSLLLLDLVGPLSGCCAQGLLVVFFTRGGSMADPETHQEHPARHRACEVFNGVKKVVSLHLVLA